MSSAIVERRQNFRTRTDPSSETLDEAAKANRASPSGDPAFSTPADLPSRAVEMVEDYPTRVRPGKLSLVYRSLACGEERTTAPHEPRPCPNWSRVRCATAASSSTRCNWGVVSAASAA